MAPVTRTVTVLSVLHTAPPQASVRTTSVLAGGRSPSVKPSYKLPSAVTRTLQRAIQETFLPRTTTIWTTTTFLSGIFMHILAPRTPLTSGEISVYSIEIIDNSASVLPPGSSHSQAPVLAMRRPVLPPFPAGEGGSAPHLAVIGGEDVGVEADTLNLLYNSE